MPNTSFQRTPTPRRVWSAELGPLGILSIQEAGRKGEP